MNIIFSTSLRIRDNQLLIEGSKVFRSSRQHTAYSCGRDDISAESLADVQKTAYKKYMLNDLDS